MTSFLLIAVCLLLVSVILLQNSKGLIQNTAAVKVIGVSRHKRVIEKATWGLALVFALVCMYL